MIKDFRIQDLGFHSLCSTSCWRSLSQWCKCSHTSHPQPARTVNIQHQTLFQLSVNRDRAQLQLGQASATAICAVICLPVNIIVERVVTSKGNQWAKTQPVGEENLCGSIQPNLIAGNNFLKKLFLHLRSRSYVCKGNSEEWNFCFTRTEYLPQSLKAYWSWALYRIKCLLLLQAVLHHGRTR